MTIEWTDWITAIASAVTGCTVFLIWLQYRDDHERSRREKVIELMTSWTTQVAQVSPGTRFVIKFLRGLNDQQCKFLWEDKPFEVNKENKELITECLRGHTNDLEFEEKYNDISLNQNQVSILRAHVVTFLNLLESIFAAWHHNIADRDMIRDEFGPNITPKKGDFPLDCLRITTGVYPSIAAFTDYMRKEYEKPTGKPPIGKP